MVKFPSNTGGVVSITIGPTVCVAVFPAKSVAVNLTNISVPELRVSLYTVRKASRPVEEEGRMSGAESRRSALVAMAT